MMPLSGWARAGGTEEGGRGHGHGRWHADSRLITMDNWRLVKKTNKLILGKDQDTQITLSTKQSNITGTNRGFFIIANLEASHTCRPPSTWYSSWRPVDYQLEPDTERLKFFTRHGSPGLEFSKILKSKLAGLGSIPIFEFQFQFQFRPPLHSSIPIQFQFRSLLKISIPIQFQFI